MWEWAQHRTAAAAANFADVPAPEAETFQQQFFVGSGGVDTFGSTWLYIVNTSCKFLAGHSDVKNFGAAAICTLAVQKHRATTGKLEPIRSFFPPYNIITHSCWECIYSDFQI